MRICQFLLSRGDGGLEKHVRELSHSLLEAGHDVFIIADPLFIKTLPQSLQQHATPISASMSRHNPILWMRLLKILQQLNIDIVHAQASKASYVLGLLRRFVNAKTVGTLHNIKHDVSSYNKLDHIITVSKQLSTYVQHQHVSVVYNGIHSHTVSAINLSEQFNLPSHLPTFCAVGRLVSAKGFLDLLDAIDGLPLNLLIIGEGPERVKLEQRVMSLSNNTMCRLLGHRQNAPDLMAGADGILISSHREGFSYVFSEALLQHKPILATDVPVANEVLAQELIVPIGKAPLFRERLIALLNDRERWLTLMEPAFLLAKNELTIEAMLNGTNAVYDQLKNKNG